MSRMLASSGWWSIGAGWEELLLPAPLGARRRTEKYNGRGKGKACAPVLFMPYVFEAAWELKLDAI